MLAESKPTQITLQSEGILMPKVESQLIPEVSGKVIEIRENFYPGKFFEEGEEIITQAGEYHSHNTHRLDEGELTQLLLGLREMQDVLEEFGTCEKN